MKLAAGQITGALYVFLIAVTTVASGQDVGSNATVKQLSLPNPCPSGECRRQDCIVKGCPNPNEVCHKEAGEEPLCIDPRNTIFVDEPDMYEGDLVEIMDWIKAETTIVKNPFCWKGSYGRGVGLIPTDCPGKKKIGALCYSFCPSGYDRFGFDCHSRCPSDFRNDGLFCRRSEYGRGAGYPWTFSDGFSNKGMFRRCEAAHGKGKCELWGAIVYPKCKKGYSPFGCCICRPPVPNCASYGLNNGVDLSCAKKIIIGDPTPMQCSSHLERDAGLCYENCEKGYDGVGPVCWGLCGPSQVNCGAACAASSSDCASGIVDQAVSTLILAANVATLGLATPATAGASTVIRVGGKVVAGTSRVGKAVVKAVKLLQTVKPSGVAKGATLVTRIKHAKTGTTKKVKKTVLKIGKEARDAMERFKHLFATDFAGQTSPYINDMIDSRFHPKTAAYIKGYWGEIEFLELVEANAWGIAETVLSAAAIVDITGVSSVLAAYAKPTCGAAVPFPCTTADRTTCV